MPTYTVRDPVSGKTVRLTGDSPPTEAELEQVFAKVNPAAPAPSKRPTFADAKAQMDPFTAAEIDLGGQQQAGAMLLHGPGTAAAGVKEMAGGEYAKGARNVLRGGLETAALLSGPAMLRSVVAAPVASLVKAGAGVAAGGAAKAGTQALAENVGATPDQAGLAGDVAGITAGLGTASLARRAMDAMPNFARAGENFNTVMAAARQEPIDISGPGRVALRIQELADRGAPMPQVVRKFLVRVTDPKRPDLTYAEARDFYSNISRLSANETQRLTPVVAAQVTKLRVALDKALEVTAAKVGQAPAYRSAMTEYARASRLRSTAEDARDVMVKKVLPGGMAGAAAYKGYEFLRD